MTENKQRAAFHARNNGDAAFAHRIARLEAELKFTQRELQAAQTMISGVVSSVNRGKSVEIKDEWGFNAVVCSVDNVVRSKSSWRAARHSDNGKEVLVKSDLFKHDDFNKHGICVGTVGPDGFTCAQWNDEQDCYEDFFFSGFQECQVKDIDID